MALVAALALLCAVISYQGRMGRMHREAARRAQCVNNLKAIAIGIGEYAEPAGLVAVRSYGVYPPGKISSPTISPGKRCGWASLIYLLDHEGCSGCPVISPEVAWDEQGDPGRAGHMYCPSCPRPSAAKPLVLADLRRDRRPGGRRPELANVRQAGRDLRRRPRFIALSRHHRRICPDDDGRRVIHPGRTLVRGRSEHGPWPRPEATALHRPGPPVPGGMHGDWANVLMAERLDPVYQGLRSTPRSSRR